MSNIYDKASLVLIPSGTKTSKVYSQKPVNGDGDFTFSRSTAATRVNADGNIEKETQNLLVQSNNFATTWGRSNTSVTGGQSSYDGSSDAWLLSKSAASGQIGQNTTSSGVNTFSVYAKANVSPYVRLTIFEGGYSANGTAYFDLQNGVLGTTNAIDSSIENVGNGWYRCSVTFNTSNQKVYIYPADGDNDTSGTSGSIYIQDAQLEQGLVARDYIETTTAAVEGGITDNVPRLDYTDSSCPALLLEPQRTNLVYHSEYLGAWAAANCTLTSNSITSPEGVTNSFKITENSAASTQHRVSLGGIGGSSATYTISAYVKNSSGSRMAYIDMGPVTAHFNFSTETIYSAQGTADWEDAGDGWYRIWVTSNSAISVVTAFAGLSVNNSETYSGDGSSAIEFYGIQLEAGSYATSYIPTYGTSVTRNADLCLNTGISSLIGNEFTLFFDGYQSIESKYSRYIVLKGTGGTYANFISIETNPNNVVGVNVNAASSVFAAATQRTSGERLKMALRCKDNDFAFYINGVLIKSQTSGSVPVTSDFYLGYYTDYPENYNIINQTQILNSGLSNEELATLTTI